MSASLSLRFVLVYMLLGAALIAAGLGAYTFARTPALEHRIARVEAQLGDSHLTRLATVAITKAGADAGVGVTKVTVTKTVVKGDDATVYATVRFVNYGVSQTVKLKVALHRGVWQAAGVSAA